MEKSIIKQILIDQKSLLTEKQPDLIKREINLLDYLDLQEVTVVTGVRRCGKSSLLHELLRSTPPNTEVFYMDFDDPLLSYFADDDFQKAYEASLEMLSSEPERLIIIFDEVHLVEGWERWVTHFAKNRKNKVFITGSNAKMLSTELATFLTGRHHVIELFPFSFRELVREQEPSLLTLTDKTTQDKIKLRRIQSKYFEYGGFPRSYLDKNPSILKQYYKDILLKDIVVRRSIRNEKALLELGSILMTENTKLFNKSKLLKRLTIDDFETLNNYIYFIEETFLGFQVKKFDFSLGKQIKSKPKFYSVDFSLARQCGFSFSENSGAALENAVMIELLRQANELYYWNTDQGYEVDFIVKNNQVIEQAVQVSFDVHSEEVLKRETRSLLAAKDEIDAQELLLITLNPIEDKLKELIPDNIRTLTFIEWALSYYAA